MMRLELSRTEILLINPIEALLAVCSIGIAADDILKAQMGDSDPSASDMDQFSSALDLTYELFSLTIPVLILPREASRDLSHEDQRAEVRKGFVNLQDDTVILRLNYHMETVISTILNLTSVPLDGFSDSVRQRMKGFRDRRFRLSLGRYLSVDIADIFGEFIDGEREKE